MSNGYTELLVVGLVMAVVLAVLLGAQAWLGRRRAAADRRLQLGDSESGIGLVRPLAGFGPESARNRFDQWFETAVQRSGLDASPAGVVAVMLLAAIVLGAGLYYWKEQLGLAALGVLLGVGIPFAVVALLHRRYRARLQSQVPDAFRMLAGSIRSGQTFEQAVEFYTRQGAKPLADELGYCASQMRLGMNPVAALKATAERVRLLDFDLLVSTVGLYTQTGGNLVLLLERLADSVRDRNQFRGQFFAATAQSRIVAIAIGGAGPLLLLGYVLAEPEHVRTFLSSARGWSVLLGCLVLEVIGIVWLWRILKIEY